MLAVIQSIAGQTLRATRDPEKFVDLVKNTYRVLLTRGMKGCYVYFMDVETRKFVQSRIEKFEATARVR